MFNLILAIISSALVSITMRVSEGRIKNNISMLSVNYVICMILSIVYTGTNNFFQTGEGLGTAIALGTVNGFFYIFGLVLFQNSVKQNGVVLSSIFMKLGIMMPLIISIVLFHEIPTLVQSVGFIMAIIAIVLINLKEKNTDTTFEKSEKVKIQKLSLVLVLAGCGMADGMSKIYQELGADTYEEVFLVFTFVIALFLSIVLVTVKKQKITKNELVYGAMLGCRIIFQPDFC